MPRTAVPEKLSTQQIGRLGELMLQCALLRYGIDSALLTTDSGIDLVAYSETAASPKTIQVKAKLKPSPAGGTGAPLIDWFFPKEGCAELIAFVDISTTRIWLLSYSEAVQIAQQESAKGMCHLGMYTDPSTLTARTAKRHASNFDQYLLEEQIGTHFEPNHRKKGHS